MTITSGSTDQITDFRRTDDALVISLRGLTQALKQNCSSLKLGESARFQLVLGSSAQDTSDRFIYS